MTLRGSMLLPVALLAALVWSLFAGPDREGPALDRAAVAYDGVALHESDLHRGLLSARAGLLRSYDPVNEAVTALASDLERLQASGLAADAGGALRPLAARQAELVETFKSNNALLQNGLAYFSLFSRQLQAPAISAPLARAANDLSAAMLQLTLDTSPETAGGVERQLALLQAQPAPDEAADTVSALLAHGHLLARLLPKTDAVLKQILALPFAAAEVDANALIVARQQAERARAGQHRLLLFATAALLLVQVAYFALQLQRRQRAAQRRAVFERAVAALSVSLIECDQGDLPTLVRQALARLAEVAGGRHAYFLVGGTSPDVFSWALPDTIFPQGWPLDAGVVARALPPGQYGVTHVADVGALPEGPVRQRLLEAGVRSWTAIPGDGHGSLPYLLGLDRGRAEEGVLPAELRLLRMAYDAIAGAVRRETLIRGRARMQSAVQRAKQVETIAALTGGVAHNFNNIVGTILGYAEMMEQASPPHGRLAGQVVEIRKAGERARTLVEQLLSYGRRREVRGDLVDMAALVAETVTQLRFTLPAGARIEAAFLPCGPATVDGQAAQLQQVVVNLCRNASDAMDDQGVVAVACDCQGVERERGLSHGRLAAGAYVRIAVGDTGRGIEADTLGRIFEPFFTTRALGNGLGLATVWNIVAEHGGALHVESTPGAGSRFEVWLPRSERPADPVPATQARRQLGSGEIVALLADDGTPLLQQEEIIAALGYEPVGFASPDRLRAAIDTAPRRFDVAILDVADPTVRADIEGFLRTAAPDLPVIVLSDPTHNRSGGDPAALPAAAVMTRPWESRELAEALRQALERRQRRSVAGG